MKILGVNISHNMSICVYENNKIVEFWNEERFILNKDVSTEDYKAKLFQSILHKINFKPDLVCYSSYGRFYDSTDEDVIKFLQKQLDNPPYYFNKKEHHIYHALSGKYFSSFEEAVCIVVDGGGACNHQIPFQEVESVYYVNNKQITPIYKHSTMSKSPVVLIGHRFWKKILKDLKIKCKTYIYGYEQVFSSEARGGQLFDFTCVDLGFKNGHNAGKLMGLSSYANTDKKYDLDYNKVKIANDLQEKVFEDTCKLIEKFKFKSKNIILSGGCALNCSNNFKYVKKYPELFFFVDPIPGDSGTAIGACIYHEHYK